MATCHDEGVFNALMGKSGVVDVKVDARGQIEVLKAPQKTIRSRFECWR